MTTSSRIATLVEHSNQSTSLVLVYSFYFKIMQVKAKTNKDWYMKMGPITRMNFYNNMVSLGSLKNFNDFLNNPLRYRNTFKKFIYAAFVTIKTQEGIDYWENVIAIYSKPEENNFYINQPITNIYFNNIKNNEQYKIS